MKKILIVFAAALLAAACGTSAKPISTSNTAANSTPQRSETAISHGPPEQAPGGSNTAAPKGKWTQGGDAFDTSTFDSDIAKAEKALSAKPSDAAAKKDLGTAYFKRAVALTEKRQYASALGDYRRAVKYDPSNEEAKNWIGQIISIYDSINKASPPEGEEPPPLPFKKGN
jgi:tetratricopeptide (TPR) repeat protein